MENLQYACRGELFMEMTYTLFYIVNRVYSIFVVFNCSFIIIRSYKVCIRIETIT